ncbi:MAG: phosphomannomutase/phosphoglucomutase [Armatimonadota bacterium]
MPESLPRHVFREYDIRGIAEPAAQAEMTPALARDIGRAWVAELGAASPHIVVGRDNRPSADEIAEAFLEGLVAAGCRVTDVGRVPTPVVWFYVAERQADGGAVVTASHKSPEYNGMKLRRGQVPFVGEEIQRVRERITRSEFPTGRGSVRTWPDGEAVLGYLVALGQVVSLDRPLRVVVDTGNGIASRTVPPLFDLAGCDVVTLETDWHAGLPPEPLDPNVPEQLGPLGEAVSREAADLGIAIDPDGDRLGIVDEQGEVVPPDLYVIPLCREILARGPDEFVFDVRCSEALLGEVRKLSGRPHMSACGYPNILKGMARHRAALGAETTGHIFLRSLTERLPGIEVPFDDAAFGAVRLAERLAASEHSLSAMLADVPRYRSSPEFRLNCPDEKKFGLVEAVKQRLGERFGITDIDGVRFSLGEGWGLVRASNTGPELVIRFEAREEETYRRLAATIVDELVRFDYLDEGEVASVADAK